MFPLQRSFYAAAFALVIASPALAGNLVQNGDFETGEFFPWIVPPSIPFQSLFSVLTTGGHDGPHLGRLSSTQLQYMTQILPTMAGQDYELSFWLRRLFNSPAPFVVRWEGQIAFGQSVVLPNNTDWFEFTIPLHANINGSLIEFGQMTFPNEFHIDDISVVQVPAPGAAPLLLIGGVVALRRRRR